MRHIPYIPPYARPGHGFLAAAETGVTCPICGEDVCWWEEEWEMKNEQICHAACVEREADRDD